MKHDEPVTMCSLESETMYSLEWLRHERRKAWQEGYALDEIAPLVPQVPKAEIAAIIHQHDKETRL